MVPAGVDTWAISPTSLPKRPLPIGDVTEIFFSLRLASASDTKVYVTSLDSEGFEFLHADNTVVCQVKNSRNSIEEEEGEEGAEAAEGEGAEAAAE